MDPNQPGDNDQQPPDQSGKGKGKARGMPVPKIEIRPASPSTPRSEPTPSPKKISFRKLPSRENIGEPSNQLDGSREIGITSNEQSPFASLNAIMNSPSPSSSSPTHSSFRDSPSSSPTTSPSRDSPSTPSTTLSFSSSSHRSSESSSGLKPHQHGPSKSARPSVTRTSSRHGRQGSGDSDQELDSAQARHNESLTELERRWKILDRFIFGSQSIVDDNTLPLDEKDLPLQDVCANAERYALHQTNYAQRLRKLVENEDLRPYGLLPKHDDNDEDEGRRFKKGFQGQSTLAQARFSMEAAISGESSSSHRTRLRQAARDLNDTITSLRKTDHDCRGAVRETLKRKRDETDFAATQADFAREAEARQRATCKQSHRDKRACVDQSTQVDEATLKLEHPKGFPAKAKRTLLGRVLSRISE